MSQLIALALVGAAVYAVYRWLWRPVRMIVAEIRRPAARSYARDMGRLEYDPRTGVYRPVRRD